MDAPWSIEQLAELVNQWSDQHQVFPVNGQAAPRLTARNIRYYRALGLLDAPNSGGRGFEEKHRLQLVAIRLLQARGLPLQRIQELLFGRSLKELQRIESQGLAELDEVQPATFRPSVNELWSMTPLNEEFMLLSRRGRGLSAELRERLLNILEEKPSGAIRARKGKGT